MSIEHVVMHITISPQKLAELWIMQKPASIHDEIVACLGSQRPV